VSPEPSYFGVTDTYLNGHDGFYRKYGQGYELKINYDGRHRTLLRFDLSSYIPRGAIVTAAELELYAYNKWFFGVESSIGVYEILRPWAEDEATWYDAAPGDSWQEPGCDGVDDKASVYAALATFQYTSHWQSWEDERLVELVQRWVSDPSSNHGVILLGLSPPNAPQWWTLHSSQYPTDKTLRPRLRVDFYLLPPTLTPTPTNIATPTYTATPIPSLTRTSTATRVATATNTPTVPGWYEVFLPVAIKR